MAAKEERLFTTAAGNRQLSTHHSSVHVCSKQFQEHCTLRTSVCSLPSLKSTERGAVLEAGWSLQAVDGKCLPHARK